MARGATEKPLIGQTTTRGLSQFSRRENGTVPFPRSQSSRRENETVPCPNSKQLLLAGVALLVATSGSTLSAAKLDDMSLERWARLREVEIDALCLSRSTCD